MIVYFFVSLHIMSGSENIKFENKIIINHIHICSIKVKIGYIYFTGFLLFYSLYLIILIIYIFFKYLLDTIFAMYLYSKSTIVL